MVIQRFQLHAAMSRSVLCFENLRKRYFSLSDASVGKNAGLISIWLCHPLTFLDKNIQGFGATINL
jgi:hypothetical protein